MADHSRKPGPLRRVPPRVWVALALLILAIVFVVQNRQEAHINLLMISISAPMWIALTACVLLGLLIAWLGRRR
ncbi:LapA family protein [Nonomuraea sp. NPDC050310]|uniref:LapA family protein n=1 Tax=unclassified Nonomuraea TaxID=2593643 RepID=UPI0034088068